MHKRIWHLTAIYFPASAGMYAMTFWMPQLIKAVSSGYSNTAVGVFVMIPYAVALVAMIILGQSSDRRLERRYHAAVPLIIGGIAFLLLSTASTRSAFLPIALWCLVASGIECAWSPIWSLPNEFLAGYSAAAGIAFINSVGNLGGFVGPYAMGAISRTTGSFRGGLALAGFLWFISAILLIALPKERH